MAELYQKPEQKDNQVQLDHARRYRLAAMQINDPALRQSYIDKAAAIESAAGLAGADDQRQTNTEPTPDPAKNLTTHTTENDPPTPDISLSGGLPYSVRVHSTLAQKIISDKESTRAYALWSVLRSVAGPGHLDKADVIDLAMGQTGKAQSTVYEWLAIGEGTFWNSEGGRLWLIGKERVIDHFLGSGVRPGAVVMVPVDLILTRRLHVVRATLSSTWVTSDGGKIAARITRRENIQGVPESTQRTYDHTAEVKIKPLSVMHKQQRKQLSNLYYRPDNFATLTIKKRSKNQIFGYRATEFNEAVNAQMGAVANDTKHKFGRRMYFNSARRAVAVAEYRKENDIDIPVYLLAPTDRLSKRSGPAVGVTWLH